MGGTWQSPDLANCFSPCTIYTFHFTGVKMQLTSKDINIDFPPPVLCKMALNGNIKGDCH